MLYFVLPAYNEEKDLPRMFEEFSAVSFPFPYRIIVVNDGSTDRTGEVVERYSRTLPIDLVDHGENRGLGKALRTGLAEAAGRLNDGDLVVTMDSDGTHPLEAVYGIKEKVEAGCDVVVASRFVDGGQENGVNAFRRMLSHTASFGLRLLWPIRGIRDYSSGYRGYSRNMVMQMRQVYGERMVEEGGFSSTLELLLKASLLGGTFDEVPLRLRYDCKRGASKMRVGRTVLCYVRLLARLSVAARRGGGSPVPRLVRR